VPIRPENRKHYRGQTWRNVRERVLDRAGNRCEGSPAYPDCRAKNYEAHPVTGSRVILTVAHMDHDPANNDMRNLRAWCQRCHNTWDAPMRAAGVKARREPDICPKFAEAIAACEAAGCTPAEIAMVIRRSVE